jgi:hypothetical protein
MPERGDKKLCGCYWSPSGPIRIDLYEYIWDGEKWVMPGSPIGVMIRKELGEEDAKEN